MSAMFRRLTWLLLATAVVTVSAQSTPAWHPSAGPLSTRWTATVSPARALPEYPRPQMVRPDWTNLNGLWDYAIRPRGEGVPAKYDGRILVPFPVESALSGVMKKVGDGNRLWYRRTFTVPTAWRRKHLRLHFGAVDWEATVQVNGHEIGSHRGGYDGFDYDITSDLHPTGPQELIVGVWDPTDAGSQPRGKQVASPHGIWYTSVTGIWQTVWIEPVAQGGIDGLTLVPDIDAGLLHVTVASSAPSDLEAIAVARDGTREVGRARGRPGDDLAIAVPHAKLWSPNSPSLYDLKVSLVRGGITVDAVTSYFAMRKSSLCKDPAGTTRLCLNNAPLFQVGPLDQGWWPDGLYTAPTDAALKLDIEVEKRLGFNMARKHVKVEPDRWYYWADTLGLIVWQDMPSTVVRGDRSDDSKRDFEAELKALIDGRRNHPSIVMWVPFNEGWGQYDTPRIVQWIKSYDPSRLVDDASGWTDEHVGDVADLHRYPGPGAPKAEANRAIVLGEFGGLGLPLAGHTWQEQANWSYKGFATRDELTSAFADLFDRLHLLVGNAGLSAAVYTQTSDVEVEVNGLMTYDRAVIKPDEVRVRAAVDALFTPAPIVRTVLETSYDTPARWRYTTSAPSPGWTDPAFDDASWMSGPGGFGAKNTPGSAVRTEWRTADIWLRRTFQLAAVPAHPHFLLHHDEDAEVYVNGVLALSVTGYTQDYQIETASADLRSLLKSGANTLAVHCHQTTGGQYIDVGIVDVVPVKRAPIP